MAAEVASSVFNAFAFAGAGWIFSKINHTGYASEMRRHNEAMEKLSKERDLWNEKRLDEIDRVNNLRYEKKESGAELKSTNSDLDYYASQYRHSTHNTYATQNKPSDKMQKYITIVKYISGIAITSLVMMVV